MNKKSQARLEILIKALESTFHPLMPEEAREEDIQLSMKTLKRIAKTEIPIDKCEKAIIDNIEQGTHGPLIALGIMKEPKYKTIWFANVTSGKVPIDHDFR